MMRYLVTGGSGFIGSRLVGLLKSKNCKIRLLSRTQQSNLETVLCDLGKETIPAEALEGVDIVFHIAGYAHDTKFDEDNAKLYHLTNVKATLELANLALQKKVKHFVFISSVKAGGTLDSKECLTEKNQTVPDGIYGHSKRKAEINLLKIESNSDMRVSIIRPALVYGPNQKGNLKSMTLGINKGWFPPLPETGNRRSMIHVDDLVRAIFFISQNPQLSGEIFIATDGKTYSSREIFNEICRLLNKRVPNWEVPILLFRVAGIIAPQFKYKIDKLFGDECYSSSKLQTSGFKATKTIKDMHETDF